MNELVLAEGRSLDRIAQADMVQSFTRLRSSLTHLMVAQYWSEVVLYQALSQQPQQDLFLLLVEHLGRLERSRTPSEALPLLVHGLYHLLAIAGVAPQVRPCSDCPGTSEWSFSPDAGGVACHYCIGRQQPLQRSSLSAPLRTVLKLLPRPQLPQSFEPDLKAWLSVERLLRKSVQYHFDREIRSALLVDTCFASPSPATATKIRSAEVGGTYG